MKSIIEKDKNELLILFENLVSILEETKKIRNEAASSDLLFKVYEMNSNTRSKLFSDSSSIIDPEIVGNLLQEGFIQRIASEAGEKYALTFKGIVHSVYLRYGINIEEQFIRFLELSDGKNSALDQTGFTWKEKLATLSLILLCSTNPSSAIFLTSEYNKEVLSEVFRKTLNCLKKYKVVSAEEEIGTVSRGESPVSALMSRLQTLSSKTNHLYKFVGKGSVYYLDLERDGVMDQSKMFFLLRKIFENFNLDCIYNEMAGELAEIGQRYIPRFQDRKVKASTMFSLMKNLEDFLDIEIRRLPTKKEDSKNDYSRYNLL